MTQTCSRRRESTNSCCAERSELREPFTVKPYRNELPPGRPDGTVPSFVAIDHPWRSVPVPGFDAAGQSSPKQASPELENQDSILRRARYGRILFLLYLVLYVGFVWLNAFEPEVMGKTPLAGINLAVLYGLALIAIAFILALLYDWLCREPVETPAGREGGR